MAMNPEKLAREWPSMCFWYDGKENARLRCVANLGVFMGYVDFMSFEHKKTPRYAGSLSFNPNRHRMG
jgi:hypothetical protein